MEQDTKLNVEDGEARPETVTEPTPVETGDAIAEMNGKLDAIMAALGIADATKGAES